MSGAKLARQKANPSKSKCCRALFSGPTCDTLTSCMPTWVERASWTPSSSVRISIGPCSRAPCGRTERERSAMIPSLLGPKTGGLNVHETWTHRPRREISEACRRRTGAPWGRS